MSKHLDASIRVGTHVAADREAVYDGIATAAGLDGWFTSGAVVEAKPGGRIVFRWKDWGVDRVTAEEEGRVIEADRPARFVFEWHPDGPDYATTVEIDFEEADDGTNIRLREHGYRDTPSGLRRMLGCASGWGEALTLWKFYIEHGIRY